MKLRNYAAALAVPVVTLAQCGQPQCAPQHSGVAIPGNCDSYVPLFQKYGLPVSTFKYIAWRESGCNHTVFVSDSDDYGGGLLGINFKGSNAAVWRNLCGATVSQVTNADTNVRCAAAAYRVSGLRPWSM